MSEEIRHKARELLESGQVDCVIGYEASPRGGARPAFVYDPAEADRLIWDATCVHNLVTYLHDKKKPRKRGEEPPRVGVVVKPCDSRAINVLLAEQQIERERVFIIGVACELPEESGRPVTHWTPRELADEVIQRGIVESISPRHVDRVLKGGICAHTRASTG